ncbi:MAG: AsmA family protein [Alphaproteobacteria bacterium]
MRKLFLVILVPVFLIAIFVGILFLMPLNSLRGPMERAVTKAIGRPVHVTGALHASLYPEIGLSAGDVSIDNVEGGQAKVFARAGTLAVGARLMPLFSRQVEITRLTLQDPEIHLEVDARGNPNWNFHFASSSSSSDKQSKLSISGLKITNGLISYFDARKAATKTLEKANANFSMAALDQPAVFDVDAQYNGEQLAVTGRVDSPDSFTRKLPTKVLLDLKSRLLVMHFDGTVTGATQSEGNVVMSGPSLRELIKSGAGASVKTGGLGAFTLSGAVSSKDRVYALKNAKASLDGMHASANMAVDMNGTVPSLKGDVSLDHLNLATYMVAGGSKPAASGWSSERISLDGLKDADADVDLKLGTLTLGKFVISQGAGHLTVQDGKLTANLAHAGLFGGTITGRLAADPDGAIALKADVSGVAMKTLLISAIKVDRLEGTGALAMDMTGRGLSQRAIMESLRGTASVTVRNGAIRGVDLAAMARKVQNALQGNFGGAAGDKASTDFAEAGGSFTITNGVMHNSDFHLLNPFVRITGAGDIGLGARTLNFRVEPKAVLNTQGQGGARDAAGLGVPFFVSGPWTHLSYKPDMKALAGTLVQQVTSGQGALGGLLGGVLGGKKSNDASAPQKKQGFDLNSLFGR